MRNNEIAHMASSSSKVLLLVLGLALMAGQAAAQGFWRNCTEWTLGWDDATVYRRFMVAECPDRAGEMRASFLPLNDCITNKEGEMMPKKNGGVADSCAHCTQKKSVLTCDCGRSWGGPTTTSIDLNTVIKNVDGVLGCFDYMGIEIDSMDASPA